MKFRGFCDSPADDRGVYVEALSIESAKKKMVSIISAIYECSPEDVSLYNVESELDNPDGVLEFVCGWQGDEPIAWDDDPIIAYISNSENMRVWSNKPLHTQDLALAPTR